MKPLFAATLFFALLALAAACKAAEEAPPNATPSRSPAATPTAAQPSAQPTAKASATARDCVINAVGTDACGEGKIAFTRFALDSPDERIFLINLDATGLTQLTSEADMRERNPRIAPDGTKIAFARSLAEGQFDIYVMNPDGTGKMNLTNNPADDDAPDWSPDGQFIAFMSIRDGFDIYVMNSDGSGQTRLTEHPGDDMLPVWSPDGSSIAFVSNRDGDFKWWVMSADGSDERLLSDIEVYDPSTNLLRLLQGAWNPNGDLFVTSLLAVDKSKVISIDPATGELQNESPGDATAPVYCFDLSVVVAVVFELENDTDLQLVPGPAPTRITTAPGWDIPGSCGIVATP